MKRKTLFKKGIVLLLTASMLLTGCANGTTDTINEDAVAIEDANEKTEETATEKDDVQTGSDRDVAKDELALSLKEKYNGAASSEYSGETINVDRTQSIEVKLGYNPWNSSDSANDMFAVYQDAELKHKLDVTMDWDMNTGVLTISPLLYGIAEVDEGYGVDLSHLSGDYLFSDEEAKGWGNLPQYYLSVGVNTETGEKLAKPEVTVVKVNAELSQTPQVKFSQTEDGEARFYWEEVPGAEEYLVFTMKKWPDKGFDYNAEVVGVSKTNEWICESDVQVSKNEERSTYGMMNEMFTQYYIAEDNMELSKELLGEDNELLTADYNEYWDDYFGVIAVGKSGCSYISNLMSAQDLCHLLPHEIAYKANEDTFFERAQGAINLPTTMGVIMCDGTTAQKVIDYDYENITINEEYKSVEIKATAHGTKFSWPIKFEVEDLSTVESDLQEVKKRQEELLSKGGNIDTEISFDEDNKEAEEPKKEEPKAEEVEEPKKEEPKAEEVEEPKKEEPKAEEVEEPKKEEPKAEEVEEPKKEEPKAEEKEEPKKEENNNIGSGNFGITANSAMSEYIAICMLGTESAIDLSLFEEASDTSAVVDAFAEAQYQNPLVLGIQDASMDTQNKILYIEYDYDAETTAKKQNEIVNKVNSIVSEIITEDMSDLEKEMAINSYLCETVVYDDAALENAEANDFYYVDEEFYDSFTAYGILMDGVGVCAGYSAAFKLLAEAAGLESIVVTGYLDGSLPHAWNKVNIDGEWNIVDSTNNDNEVIPNALLNLSDSSASMALLEDDRFVMDVNLYDYAANTDDNEYYRTTGNFFSLDEVSSALSSGLTSDSDVVVRTDYDLDEETFYMLASDAAQDSGKTLQGCYWMGIIRLMEE